MVDKRSKRQKSLESREALIPAISSHHDPEIVANLSKTDPAYGHLIKETSEFRDSGLKSTFPNFMAQENKLATSLDDLDAQIKNITGLTQLAKDMIAQFNNESEDTKAQFEKYLETFENWKSPVTTANELQSKVKDMKTVISESRNKLADISKEVSRLEQESIKSGHRNTAIVSVASISVIILSMIVYMYIMS